MNVVSEGARRSQEQEGDPVPAMEGAFGGNERLGKKTNGRGGQNSEKELDRLKENGSSERDNRKPEPAQEFCE